MFRFNLTYFVLLITSFTLTACGGGGGSDSSSGNDIVNSVFSGSVGDGPIVNALVTVYDNTGKVLDSTSSSSSANYQINVRTGKKSFPLSLHANGGTDIVSNSSPNFELVSVALSPADKKNININPYSTFIVKTASHLGGINAVNVELATQHVLNALNFGLDTSLITDPLGIELDETTIANFIKSTEVLGEAVRRTRQALLTQSVNVTHDQIVDAISADVIDGVLDGTGATGTNPRISATWNLIVADVGIEAMVNGLKVNGTVATTALDNAIYTSLPDAPAGTTTASVTINQKLINMVIASVQAAQTISTDSTLVDLENTLAGLAANLSASDIDASITTSFEQSVNNVVTDLSSLSFTQMVAINDTISSNNTVPDEPVQPTQVNPVVMVSTNAELSNAQPLDGATIEGNVYIFFQEGSDWATRGVNRVDFYCCKNASVAHVKFPSDFSSPYSINVDLSGYTAGETYELYADVVFADQFDPVPFYAYFTINNAGTTTPANFAPTISGIPTTTVEENSTYSFRPIANDSDGDTLTFSIQNKPVWANFNTTTGELSGVPTASHIGSYTNIVISVSDGSLFDTLPSFNIEVTALPATSTGTATLSWVPPTEYTDGTPLTDLAGYKIRYGTSMGNYTTVIDVTNPGLTSYVVENLTGGNTYYFVITAYNSAGIESGYSTVGSKTIP